MKFLGRNKGHRTDTVDRSPMCLALPLRLPKSQRRRKGSGADSDTVTMTATFADQHSVDPNQGGLPSAVSAVARLQELRSGASTGWEWQTLEDELNRREMKYSTPADRNDDENGSTLVRSDDDPKEGEDTTKSADVVGHDSSPCTSIDAVIRKVSLLRAPLNYDEPEATPMYRQKRWLAAVFETIEMERLHHQIQRETKDDATRDPHPGADESVIQHTFVKPSRREDRGQGSRSAEGRDDDDCDDTQSGATARKEDCRTANHEPKRDDPPSGLEVGHGQAEPRRKSEGDGSLQLVATYEVEYQGIARNEYSAHFDTDNEGEDSVIVDDDLETAMPDQSKQSDYVYLQIEERNTSGDDDISVSSMEYLFNWLTCVNAEEELGQRKQFVETRKVKEKHLSAQGKLKSSKVPGGVKAKRVRSSPRNASATPTKRASQHISRDSRRHTVESDLEPNCKSTSTCHRRHLPEPVVPQHNLNYRPSLRRGNRSSSTVNTLSTSERVACIIDRPDAWLTIGASNSRSLSEDGEGVQLSPKRKPTLHVPEGDPLATRQHHVTSARARLSRLPEPVDHQSLARRNKTGSKQNRVAGRPRK